MAVGEFPGSEEKEKFSKDIIQNQILNQQP